ncbi:MULTISPECIES: hypothetical protein [unclassified Herbaspirillum]|uniref:hypothetical protein n=1 Tax=unclassified Herbaspirillum TaxID=2624150 RepID=UPI000E2F9EEF|nr:MULTISPECIES: hypothetical protein [unclassified Herbaspirillum]RFB67534.1 hypothetical protein DZB54_20455 [Herbaspirillum sp. 3R-3a1]TFI05143.1 hypothetical protein E4P32_23420 [Herbaspirillum sp. 3R11]TFI12527.1 hypothetical protein E4P31_20945 [Herbaspirillum sp. 3R-11]TFI28326.1 hypothetical protein E4P30_08470 [Herbaspirillum sp. 3C11]
MSDTKNSAPTESATSWERKATTIKYVLQLAFGSYTHIRTSSDRSVVPDRKAVTNAVLTALLDIDLTSSEITELYALFSLAQLTVIRENAIIDNLSALLDLASELQNDERTEFLEKFTVLNAQAKARESAAV